MAALESLNFNAETAIHYIHCVLSNVPMTLALSEVAPMVVPSPESPTVKALEAIGCRIVPHQLNMFKEPLERKFGFVNFFIHESSRAESQEEVHELALRWISRELTDQLASVNVNVTLGQPPECYSAIPFLRALQEECSFLDTSKVRDSKKLETFLLSKIHFDDAGSNLQKNNEAEGKKKEDGARRALGSFRISSLGWKELLWLSRGHSDLPPILITNGNISTATCEQEALRIFFEGALSPLIRVLP
ncbi:hypothetical protein MOQ_002936 [Trypanosoma cruzi marinkellei]|uniref:Uncharacterized protein n=1 Tax=Trypanosoma cruzi marinkellei TaxID=85056 RepID=K2MDE4_TRYCR|nr:hypothetical protein MOQ_002936 [Trypanosoma cruzi marinkellei]